ncbi:hypothetical protein REPUB_Repub19eG0117000 [Reevesia pubescens]
MRQVSQQIFIFVVKAAGESAPELSKEATGVVICIMKGEESFEQFSPEVRIKDPNSGKSASLLPLITLFHGTSDYSIPSDASINFVDALKAIEAEAELILYQGKSHTDLFLQVSDHCKLFMVIIGTPAAATLAFLGEEISTCSSSESSVTSLDLASVISKMVNLLTEPDFTGEEMTRKGETDWCLADFG